MNPKRGTGLATLGSMANSKLTLHSIKKSKSVTLAQKGKFSVLLTPWAWAPWAIPVALAASTYLITRLRRRPMIKTRKPVLTSHEAVKKLEKKWGDSRRDAIEQASWESFPASDPPAW